MASIDSLKTRRELVVGDKTYAYYSLAAAEEAGLEGVSRLPISMKVLLENLLRNEDGLSVGRDDLQAVAAWADNKGSVEHEISFRPARVLMQDFTGVPAVVDLAAMRDAMTKLGANPEKINPLNPVDLVIDHSVMVDNFGNAKAFELAKKSTITEWSMTRSTGASGLIFLGSPPRFFIASRMAARSTTAGTPVKSCMSTRAGR